MKESAKPSPPARGEEAPQLERTPGVAVTPASDELASTLHPSDGTPSQGGVARTAPAWNLPQEERGRYLLQGVVAEGGHGRILQAQDLHLERMVALKEPISRGTSTEDRFLREARITARLQHPAIVPVYQAGRWPGGEPFYAMKFVSGRSLAHLIEPMRTLSERLAALPHVLAVAEAMAYAHSQRIIHRDLKPSNVLVGEFGETVVIDWGLAKELDRPEAPAPESSVPLPASLEPERTQLGTVMGTPAYMPPEQALGQPVDERADVYALGAILYHLLSGQVPYTGPSSLEVVQRVISEEPTPLARLQPRLTEELLDIVSRAMARDPARRYLSARELAEDLRRFLTGQLVGAHRYTRWERMLRFARRHRAALIVGAVALVVVVVGEATDRHRIRLERDRAEQKQVAAEKAEREATQRADTLTLMEARNSVAWSPGRVFTLLDSLSAGFNEWGRARTLAADALAQGVPVTLRAHTTSANHAAFSPDGRQVVSSSDDRTVRLWEVDSGGSRILETYEDEVWVSFFSPDGRYVASAGKNGQVRLQELATGTSRLLSGHTDSVVSLRFSSDGRRLFSCGYDGAIWQWEVDSGTGRRVGTHDDDVTNIALLPDKRHLVSAGARDLTVRLWNLEDGSGRILLRTRHPISTLAAAQQGGAFAVGTHEGQILLWDSVGGSHRTLDWKNGSIHSLEFSPDGRYLAAQSSKGPIQLWELEGGTARTLASTPGWWSSIAFSADGQWLAAGSREGKVRLWELSSGRLRVLHGAGGAISMVSFSRDGRWVVAASHDGVVRLHEVEDRSTRILARHTGQLPMTFQILESRHRTLPELKEMLARRVAAMVPTPDGRHVLSVGGLDARLQRTHLDGTSVEEVRGHANGLVAAHALPDGTRLLTAAQDGTVVLWNERGQQLQQLAGPSQRIQALSVSADGARVAAGDASGAVWLWEVASGQGRTLGRHEGSVFALAFSPDGRHLASGGRDGALRLWDVTSGAEREVHRHQSEVTVVAFSPDGYALASGSSDHTAWLQPMGLGPGQLLTLGAVGVSDLHFSPDGQQLFTASMGEPRVRSWDVSTGRPLASFEGHSNFVVQMDFSPDGQRLATASVDGTVRLWDVRSGTSRALQGHDGPVTWVAFSRDGRNVLSAGQDGTVRLWRDDLPLESQALRAWLSQMAAE